MSDWGFYIIANAKIKVRLTYGWRLKLFKKKKDGMVGFLIYFKC